MPIHQQKLQVKRGQKHISWLKEKYSNVNTVNVDLSELFENFKNLLFLYAIPVRVIAVHPIILSFKSEDLSISFIK